MFFFVKLFDNLLRRQEIIIFAVIFIPAVNTAPAVPDYMRTGKSGVQRDFRDFASVFLVEIVIVCVIAFAVVRIYEVIYVFQSFSKTLPLRHISFVTIVLKERITLGIDVLVGRDVLIAPFPPAYDVSEFRIVINMCI